MAALYFRFRQHDQQLARAKGLNNLGSVKLPILRECGTSRSEVDYSESLPSSQAKHKQASPPAMKGCVAASRLWTMKSLLCAWPGRSVFIVRLESRPGTMKAQECRIHGMVTQSQESAAANLAFTTKCLASTKHLAISLHELS